MTSEPNEKSKSAKPACFSNDQTEQDYVTEEPSFSGNKQSASWRWVRLPLAGTGGTRRTAGRFRISTAKHGRLGSAETWEDRMADHDALVALHTALIDARAGYEKALKDADDPTIKPLLQNVYDLHGQAHADIRAMLTAAGVTPDESGSFMSTVHKTVIGVRSAVVGLDAGSLSSFASGEENNLAKYDEAIEAEPANTTALQGHRSRLAQAVEAMKREAS